MQTRKMTIKTLIGRWDTIYLIYVDESGKPNFTDPENYVLAAVIVDESDWQAIDAMVSSLKNRFFPSEDADTIEFHVVDIVSGKGRYKGMSMQQRFKLLEEIAKLIHRDRYTIVAILIDKKKVFPQLRDPEWVERWAWRLMCERLERFISRNNQQRGLSPRDHGLICMDSENPQADNRIRQRVRRFRRHGSIHVDSEHLIEDPFFLSSVNANIVHWQTSWHGSWEECNDVVRPPNMTHFIKSYLTSSKLGLTKEMERLKSRTKVTSLMGQARAKIRRNDDGSKRPEWPHPPNEWLVSHSHSWYSHIASS